MFGSNIVTPGGHYLRHFMDVRLEMKSLGRLKRTIQGNEKMLGYKVQIYCTKNRIIAPYRKWTGEFHFNRGFVSADAHKELDMKHMESILDEDCWDKWKCVEANEKYNDTSNNCKTCLKKLICCRKSKLTKCI
jgi:hypothetical protein